MQITSREVLKKLKEDGWYEVNCAGSQDYHSDSPGLQCSLHITKYINIRSDLYVKQEES